MIWPRRFKKLSRKLEMVERWVKLYYWFLSKKRWDSIYIFLIWLFLGFWVGYLLKIQIIRYSRPVFSGRLSWGWKGFYGIILMGSWYSTWLVLRLDQVISLARALSEFHLFSDKLELNPSAIYSNMTSTIIRLSAIKSISYSQLYNF